MFLAGTDVFDRAAEFSRVQLRSPVYASLYSLGYSDLCTSAVFSGADGYAKVAARLRVDYGDSALLMLYLWHDLQGILSNLTHAADHGGGLVTELWDFVGRSIDSLDLTADLAPTLNAIRKLLHGHGSVRKRAKKARDILINGLIPAINQRLGIHEYLRSGSVEGMSLTYPSLYKNCMLMGKLIAIERIRSAKVSRRLDDRNEHERRRGRHELWTIIERLGIRAAVPAQMRVVSEALKSLLSNRSPRSQNYIPDITSWTATYLGIAFGNFSDTIFGIAYNMEWVRLLRPHADQFARILLDALNSIETAVKEIGGAPNFDDFRRACERFRDADYAKRIGPATDDFLRKLENWLNATIPGEPRGRLSEARITIWINKFRTYWIPVDAARIESFIGQFPKGMEWVGEVVTDAVDYFDEQFFSDSLSYVIQRRQLEQPTASLCLLGGPRKSSSLMAYILDRRLQISHRELSDTLNEQRHGQTLIFLDDATITGTQAIHIFSELLGIWDRQPYKYYLKSLLPKQINNFRAANIEFISAIGTNLARSRLKKFFIEQNIQCQIEFGKEVPWLSDEGMHDLQAGTLVDTNKNLREPVRQLSNPIFGPSSRLPQSSNWEKARDLCSQIGFQILGEYAKEHSWPVDRRRGSSLGFSGMQGRLVFAHNVPKTTLPLLWCSGIYQGKPWIPLFPARE